MKGLKYNEIYERKLSDSNTDLCLPLKNQDERIYIFNKYFKNVIDIRQQKNNRRHLLMFLFLGTSIKSNTEKIIKFFP